MSSFPKVSRTKGTAPVVSAPDLSPVVWSLADGIQKAMTALYALQTALINIPANVLGDGIKNNRQVFHTEWNRDISFLQNCYNYAAEYIFLCEILASDAADSEVLAIFQDVRTLAEKMSDEAGHAKMRHQKVYNGLKRRGPKVSAVVSRSSNIFNRGAKQGNSTLPGASAFVATAHASFHPDGKASLLDSYSALDQIGVALSDLVVFWKYQVDALVAMSPKSGSMRPHAVQELRASEGKWKTAQAALLTAISSISASSDAVIVNPIGPRTVPDRFKTYDCYLNQLFKRIMAAFGYT